MKFRAVAYVSSEAFPLGPHDIEAVLVDARRRNREHGITGVLLHNAGNFMQFIEGTPAGVEVVYQHIRASKRHHGLIELTDHLADAREFPTWAMGSVQVSASQLVNIVTASWKRDYMAARQKRVISPGLIMLHSFWKDARGHRD
jgi:hypothetical protein